MKEGDGDGSKGPTGTNMPMTEVHNSTPTPPRHSHFRPRQMSTDSDPGSEGGLPQRRQLGVKIGGSDEDLEDRADPLVEVLPPDGGWGWMVVAASFMCNVMVDGIIFTCGMLQPYIKEDFQVSNSQVSWVASLLGGFYLLAGPFVSSLASSYGFRTVCIIGAIVASIACGISYFAASIFYLYVSYGILAGIGFGFIYVPAVIATGFYFEKKRALATGIAVCGSGIGTFILAPVNKYLLGSVGWRGTLLVYAGLVLTCIIYGLAFRPLSAETGRVVAVDEEYPGGIPLLQRIKATRDEQFQACLSTASLPPDSMAGELPPGPDNLLKLQHRQVARIIEDETGKPFGRPSQSGARLAEETILEDENETMADTNGMTSRGEDVAATSGFTLNNSRPRRPRRESEPALSGGYTASNSRFTTGSAGRRGSLHSVHSKPLFRDDAFYSGSMARLPQFNSSESMGHYRASVTHMPAADEELTEETTPCCKRCPTATKAFLIKTFDFSLCTSPTFLVLSFSGFLSLLSLFVPFNFLPTFLTEMQDEFGFKDADDAEQCKAFLMSLIGICNTIGRVLCGYISDRPKVDAIMVNNLALIVGGIATIFLPFIRNVSILYAYGIVFGLSVAVFASLRSILLVELLGLEKLTSSFGLLLLIQGFAACLGSPIAGSFADYTGDFALSFYVFGATYALSGIMCIPIRKVKCWEDKRAEAKKQANNL
ncbi:Major facilitator superfamily [Trinorchestia longiramus]|nr:Major facilitator superfamily [Trinorchestia longiramus]